MTAASYGDPEVAQVLLDAGANLEATASSTAGGVPGGSALRHAAVFGMDEVVEVLLAAGATDLVQAAAAGDLTGTLSADTPEPDRVAALRMAAAHGQLDVIDQLLAAATPVDGVDRDGSTALSYKSRDGDRLAVYAPAAGGCPRRARAWSSGRASMSFWRPAAVLLRMMSIRAATWTTVPPTGSAVAERIRSL